MFQNKFDNSVFIASFSFLTNRQIIRMFAGGRFGECFLDCLLGNVEGLLCSVPDAHFQADLGTNL